MSFVSQTDEPAVLTWRLALAPRPRAEPIGHHWWRDLVTEHWFFANHAWELAAEAATVGYKTEMAEYAAAHPRPQLGDFMRQLSAGGIDMYEWAMSR